MSREHETSIDCWCQPDEYDGVVVHRSDLEYAIFELTMIGDICVDYDGFRSTEGLMSLIDELKERAYKAVKNLSD